MDAEARLETYAQRADARLKELLEARQDEPEALMEAMRYAALGPGKRLRPALCMASSEAVGGLAEDALDAACAIELVHCFSLIHDDLPAIDNDALRRGRPTCHVQFGEAMAILAGDGLFALAFEVVAHAASRPETGIQAVSLLAEASGPRGLVGGEVADVLAERAAVEPTALRRIHERKTGALIRAACEIGARFGGGSDAQVLSLRNFGEHVGLAFQIADDLLNELSTASALGKSTGSDRARNKATYPAAWGVQSSQKLAQEAVQRALDAIEPLGGSAEVLGQFAHYVVDRLK